MFKKFLILFCFLVFSCKSGADYIALRSDEYFSLRIKWPADSNYVDINFCGSELGRWTKGKGIVL